MTHDTPGHGAEAPGPHDDPERWAPRLTRILDEQAELYRRLDELSAGQSQRIRDGKTDELIGLLAHRQTIVEEISRLNTDIEPFTRRWDELVGALPEAHRAEIRTRIDRLDALIQAINARDEADRAALEERRRGVAGEIASLGRARSAVAAYSGPQHTDRAQARFQDREG